MGRIPTEIGRTPIVNKVRIHRITERGLVELRQNGGSRPNETGKARQKSATDDNPNVEYPALERRIEETYAKCSTVTNERHLYDTYKMAIRGASDRIEGQGIIAFVTNEIPNGLDVPPLYERKPCHLRYGHRIKKAVFRAYDRHNNRSQLQ